MARTREIIIFTVLFSCIACLFFGDLLGGNSTFIKGDYSQQFFPWSGFYADSIKNFQIPLWVKHVQSGFPLFAEGQVGMLYPLNLLFFFALPFRAAYNFSFLFHILLAGLFMYLYARKMGAGTAGSFLASVLLCFGSVYAGAFINLSTLKSLCFFPAVLFLFENYLSSERKSAWFFPATGIIWGVQLLAGSVQMTFYGIGFSALYFLYRNHMAGLSWAPVLKGMVVAGLTGLLISIPQLYATFEIAMHSNRSIQTLDFALWGSFFPLALTGMVFPAFGLIFIRNNIIYIGLLGTFFAIAGMWNAKADRSNMFLLVFFIAALFFALGKYNPLYTGMLRLSGFYSFRVPSKFVYFAVFFLSVLSAKGFSLCFSGDSERLLSKAYRSFVWFIAAVVAAFLAAKAAIGLFGPGILEFFKKYVAKNIYGKPFHRYSLDTYMGKIEGHFAVLKDKLSLAYPFALYGLILIAVTLLLIPFVLRFRKKAVTGYICLGVILLELLVYSHFLEGPRSAIGRFDTGDIRQPQIYAILEEDSSIYRIYPFGSKDSLPGWAYFSMNMVYGLDSIGVYSPLMNRDYFSRLKGLGIVDDSIGVLPAAPDVISKEKDLLRKLNVKYVISAERLDIAPLRELAEEEGVFLYELKGYLPRFMFSLSTSPEDVHNAGVSVQKYSSGIARIAIEPDKEGYLLFSEKYYPGWKAFIDGTAVEIVKYSDILMAVKVPAGRHTVSFRYEPSYFKRFLPVQVAGLLVILLWAVRDMRKNARAGRGGDRG